MSNRKQVISIGDEQILQLAKVQNKKWLYSKFPNIEHITGKMIDGKKQLTIYVNDDDVLNIPKTVTVKLNDDVSQEIEINILPSITKKLTQNNFIPKIEVVSASSSVPAQLKYNIYEQSTAWCKGSICCLAEHDYKNKDGSIIKVKCAITAGHIFTGKNFYNENGFRDLSAKGGDATSNGHAIGKYWFLSMNNSMDIAAVVLNLNLIPADFNDFKRFNNKFYKIDSSSKGESVTILSCLNNGKPREAKIINEKTNVEIRYENSYKKLETIHNVMLIGTEQNGQTSGVSQGGDSGACVYHTKTNSLIGLILGSNKQSTYVLPIEKVLSNNKFTVL